MDACPASNIEHAEAPAREMTTEYFFGTNQFKLAQALPDPAVLVDCFVVMSPELLGQSRCFHFAIVRSAEFADSENDLLAAAGRGLAVLAILEAADNGLGDDRLDPARAALDEGDAHRRQGQHADAILDYTRALAQLD